jgi:HPr kinase/phosphorylase
MDEGKAHSLDKEDFVQTEVRTLQDENLADLALSLVTGGDGLDRIILKPRVQKPGLAFAGYYEYIKPGRVQIIGASESGYLRSLPPRLREKRVRDVAGLDVSCFIVTKGIDPLDEFVKECENHSIPLFRTESMSSTTITRITYFLEEAMAPRISLHAGLLDVFGIGVLLHGDSGVGKSECALDLLWRGHRLVADDTVLIKRHPNEVLIGYSSDLARHHMELRGIGIINIRDLFGVSSTREVKPIDLVVRLEKWVEGAEYDRLGTAGETYECLGVKKPLVRLPVASGRNLALLVEIAVRNFIMKLQGYDSAEEFINRVNKEILRNGVGDQKVAVAGEEMSIRDKHLLNRAQQRRARKQGK